MTAVPLMELFDSRAREAVRCCQHLYQLLDEPPEPSTMDGSLVRHGVHDIGTESYEFCRGCT